MMLYRLPRNRTRARFEQILGGHLRYSQEICDAVDAVARARRRQWLELAVVGLIITACCAWLAWALEGIA